MSRSFLSMAIMATLLPCGGARATTPACAGFGSFRHDQKLPPVAKVGDLTVSSVPANPIRIYDPASDGVKGDKGATMADTLMFETNGASYGKVSISWMSFNPGPTFLTVTNSKGVVLLRRTLDGSVQLKPLPSTYRLNGAFRLMLMNGSKESIVTSVCFR